MIFIYKKGDIYIIWLSLYKSDNATYKKRTPTTDLSNSRW